MQVMMLPDSRFLRIRLWLPGCSSMAKQAGILA